MTRDEVVASLYRCFNISSADSGINIVRIHHLLDLVATTEREKVAKEVEEWVQIDGVEDIAAAIRSMK